MKGQSPVVEIADYQHGYHFPDKSVFKTRKGLNEDIVNAISHRKEEPEWMRQFRLRSLAAFRRKAMPNWGADLSDLDFDNLYYYARPQEQQSRSWEDVPANIKETFERIGIPEAELPRLGNPFEQVNVDPMLAKGGSGLGLALVRALMEKHGGTLAIESEEGVGTTVRVTFPLVANKRAAA